MKKAPEQSTSSKTSKDVKDIPITAPTTKEVEFIDDKAELERKEAYIEPQTRDLLRNLLKKSEKTELAPTYTCGVGFTYYISNEKTGEQEQVSTEILQKLAQMRILKSSFYDAVITCPECKSTILTMHNRCPKCQSHNVTKTSLTEHIPCGNIEQRNNYKNDTCPKCGVLLVEGQFRNMGRWYICNDCGERSETPEADIICRSCNKKFAPKEADSKEIPKYGLNPSKLTEIRQNVASLEDVRVVLEELGFTITIPGLIVGEKSGIQHHFSLIATKQVNDQQMLIALDHAVSETEVQASPLILYIYKTSEVAVDIPVFVAMPKLQDTARKIAQGHNILLVEGSVNQKQFAVQIKDEIDRISKGEKPKAQTVTAETQEAPQEKSGFFSKFRPKKN
jgi:ssDNA-binding Zn-finger/Zn-ribbon topoisomerase 1